MFNIEDYFFEFTGINFSEFDDYSLVVSGSSPGHPVPFPTTGTPVSSHLRSTKDSNIETSTPYAKRFQPGTPVLSRLPGDISHIDLVESPIVCNDCDDSLRTNLSDHDASVFSEFSMSSIQEPSKALSFSPADRRRAKKYPLLRKSKLVNNESDIHSIQEEDTESYIHSIQEEDTESYLRLHDGSTGDSLTSVNKHRIGTDAISDISSTKQSPYACTVQMERLRNSLLSLHVSRRETRKTVKEKEQNNFSNSCSLFSSINSSAKSFNSDVSSQITDEEEEEDILNEEEEEEESESEDRLPDIEEDEEICEHEEEEDESDLAIAEDEPRTSLENENSNTTRYFLSTNSYLQSSRDSDRQSSASQYCTADSGEDETHHSFLTADDSLEISRKNIRKSLNHSVFVSFVNFVSIMFYRTIVLSV